MEDELFSRLIAFWSDSAIKMNAGADEAALRRFESHYRVMLPSDMRRYFLHVDGMAEDEMDPVHHVRFWSVQELQPVPDAFEDPVYQEQVFRDFYIFADYSLWAHAYAIRLADMVTLRHGVCIVGGEAPRTVAGSFAEFIESYLVRPQMIF